MIFAKLDAIEAIIRSLPPPLHLIARNKDVFYGLADHKSYDPAPCIYIHSSYEQFLRAIILDRKVNEQARHIVIFLHIFSHLSLQHIHLDLDLIKRISRNCAFYMFIFWDLYALLILIFTLIFN